MNKNLYLLMLINNLFTCLKTSKSYPLCIDLFNLDYIY